MRHCLNNKHNEITVAYYTDSKQLPDSWSNFIPQTHFLHREQLKVTEQSSLPDLSFCYVLILKKGVPILAAGFQLLQLRNKHVKRSKVKTYQYRAWQLFTGIARPKLLVGGHLFRHDIASVYYPDSIASYDAYTYYEHAIDKAMKVTCASAILIKDMPEELAKYFRNYEPDFIMLRNDISMEMSIPDTWQSLGDYETAIKHKYAQRFRKIRRPIEHLSIRELSTEEVIQHKDLLFSLYKKVAKHQQVRIGFLSADFIPELKKHDDRLKVWGGFEEDGQLAGFFSAWLYEEAFDMFYIGFDYEKNKEYNLYFNMLYFAIEQAIRHKKSRLILGRTALDAKARLGCKPRYLSTFLYIKNSLVRNRIMQIQKNTSEKEGAWESRHPFRKQG